MPKDVIITPASASVLFRNSTSTDTAYIQLDENDNLSISNVSGGLSLGTPGSDIYVGDGINNVDIIFEQNGEIRALTGKTLTLGAAGSTVNLTGTITTTSAISINPGSTVTGLNLNNNNIVNVNFLSFNEPGPTEGISWSGGNLWNIWESPDNLTTNSGGNLQFVQNGVRKATFNTSGQLDLPVGTGTSPLVISSTTLVTNLNADLLDGQHGSYYAPLNNPSLTGTPLAPTAAAGTNTTQIATTAFVQTAVSNLVDASPATLDTLNELAAALGDDPNFATTVSNSIGLKLDSSAYTASDVLTKIKTVDGTESGLDADLLDGYNSGDFPRKSENATVTGDWTFEETIKFNGGTSQSLSIGSAWFNNSAGAILLDDNGHKRITWNDGGGNFNIRAGNYYDGTATIAAKGTGDTDGGAVHIVMNSDGVDGYFSVAVAPITTAGSAVSFNNSLLVSTETSAAGAGGLQYNGAQVWHAGNDGAGSGLDADLLDGNHASAFLSSSTTSTQSGYFGNIYLYDDSTPSHYLAITNSANLTAARTLSVNVNNADRTVSLSGNLTVSSAATISGTNTGDQTNITGNAGTATALQTARTIGGVSFDGTANINLPGVNTAGNQNTTGNAANVTGTVAVANGGTGSTTKTAAFDALSPATTKGDLIVDNGTNNIRLPVGTDGDVLTADSTVAAGVKWAAAAGGGGSSTLTISNKTSNYTVVAGDLGTIINCTSGTFTVSLTAASTLGSGFNCWIWNTSTTSTDVVAIDPAGSEAIDGVQTITLRAGEGCQVVCNGTSWITGDKKTMRGYAENIVTTSRPVATGSDSVALGSSYTSGSHSFAAVITNNTSTYGAKAYGGVAIGSLATVTGSWGAVLGGYNNAVKDTKSAVVGGESNDTADTGWSVILGGKGTKPNQNSKISAGMFFSTFGDNQWGRMASFKAITTDATPKDLRWDNESYFNSRNIQALQAGELRAFRGFIVAKVSNSAGNDCKVWEVTGACKRGSTYGSASFVGTPSVNVIAYDSGASSWTIAPTIIVNNGADGFTFTFTGEAGKTIRIAGYLDTMELGYLS